MLEKMRSLIRSQDTCVLATVSGGEPHCSLMAYIADRECRVIHMITHKQTAKYRNMTENPSVSLLIDTRAEDRGTRRGQARALTVKGLFEPIDDEQEKCDIRARLLEQYPHLGELASHPEAEVFSVKIQSLQLLEGVSDSSYVSLG